MNDLLKFISLQKDRREIWDKMSPLKEMLDKLNTSITALNDNLTFFSKEREFLANKLWEAFSPDEKEKVEAYRKQKEAEELIKSFSYSCNTPFDPFKDSWYLVDFEENGNNVRFQVSCRKNEGSISGLMTFLDVHWTVWFDKNELYSIL